MELAPYKMEANLDKYTILSGVGRCEGEKLLFGEILKTLRNILTAEQFDKMGRMTAAILKLGNMRNSMNESKPMFNEIHKLLDFKSSELFSFLMMDKSGMVLKTSEYLERVESLMEVLYSSLVEFVVQAVNSGPLSRANIDLSPHAAIHVVDSCGFQDQNSEGDFSEEKSNGFNELTSNYYYESFLNFFNENRFGNYEKFREEGTEEYFVRTNYVDNKVILRNFGIIEKELGVAEKYGQLAEALSQVFPAFDNDVMKKLGTVMADKETVSENMVISVEHSFSEHFNYNLFNLYKKNSFRNFRRLKKLFGESSVLEKIETVNPSWKKSRMAKFTREQNNLFENLSDSCICFFYCLKIPKTEKKAQVEKAVFGNCRNVDFESLVLHHKNEFPYKIQYRFFVEKFNIRAKIAQIDPNLNVNFREMVGTILGHAFGEKTLDLYIIGKNSLFVREKFYEEINGMLKETQGRQRMLVFVEQTLGETLKTHVDNSNLVINIAQRFLIENCADNRFQVIFRAKEKFVKVYRKWKSRKDNLSVANGIIDGILMNFEYWNLKKVIRLQAIWRGWKVRRVSHKKESEIIGALIFQNKAQKINEKISNLLEVFFTNREIFDRICMEKMTGYVMTGICEVQKKKMELSWGRKILGKVVRQSLIREGILNIRITRFKRNVSAKRILRFMRWSMGVIKKHYTSVEKVHKELLGSQQNRVEEFEKSLKGAARNLGLSELPLQNLLLAKDEVGKSKAVYNLQVYSVNLLEKPIKSGSMLANNIYGGLGASYKDDLLKIELTNDEIVFVTQKQKLIIQKLAEKKQMELKLPMKVEKVSFVGDSFLYLEETGVMKAKLLTFEAPDSNNMIVDGLMERDEDSERVFEFTKVNNFMTRNEAICGATVCRKVFYKSESVCENIEIPRVFQMKRTVAQLALASRFMLMLDETGVVYSIGENHYGQLGLGHSEDSTRLQVVKKLVEAKEIVRQISVGESHCLASTQSNRIYGWGDNKWYQLGCKAKNYRLRFSKPRDLTSEIRPEVNTRLQVYCGKESSYVFSSNMKCVMLGRLSASLQVFKCENKKILAAVPRGVSVVGLDVKWNEYVEIVSLKVVDFRNSAFDKVSVMNANSNALFDFCWKSANTNLFGFSETLAKYLPLTILSTKIVDAKHKTENQRYDKMVENLLCLK